MSTKTNHEVDYLIRGEEMQCVDIELDLNETAVAKVGSFMKMEDGIGMQTIFGDGSGRTESMDTIITDQPSYRKDFSFWYL